MNNAEYPTYIRLSYDSLNEVRHRLDLQDGPRIVDLFGSGKGSFATSQEADDFIRKERDSWDE